MYTSHVKMKTTDAWESNMDIRHCGKGKMTIKQSREKKSSFWGLGKHEGLLQSDNLCFIIIFLITFLMCQIQSKSRSHSLKWHVGRSLIIVTKSSTNITGSIIWCADPVFDSAVQHLLLNSYLSDSLYFLQLWG